MFGRNRGGQLGSAVQCTSQSGTVQQCATVQYDIVHVTVSALLWCIVMRWSIAHMWSSSCAACTTLAMCPVQQELHWSGVTCDLGLLHLLCPWLTLLWSIILSSTVLNYTGLQYCALPWWLTVLTCSILNSTVLYYIGLQYCGLLYWLTVLRSTILAHITVLYYTGLQYSLVFQAGTAEIVSLS